MCYDFRPADSESGLRFLSFGPKCLEKYLSFWGPTWISRCAGYFGVAEGVFGISDIGTIVFGATGFEYGLRFPDFVHNEIKKIGHFFLLWSKI